MSQPVAVNKQSTNAGVFSPPTLHFLYFSILARIVVTDADNRCFAKRVLDICIISFNIYH